MSQTPSRLEIAARIHHLLLRDLGQGIDIDQMLRLERYARDVLLVCDAYKGEELAELAQQAVSPSLIVIGEVVALRKQLAWFGEQAGEQAETEASRHELKLVSLA